MRAPVMTRSGASRPMATAASERVTLCSGATEKRVRAGMGAVEHRRCHHASRFEGSAILKLHVFLQEEGLEFLHVEIGENRAMPVEDGRFRLAGDAAHFGKCFIVGGDVLLAVADAMVTEEVDDLLAPRAAGFDVEDGEC